MNPVRTNPVLTGLTPAFVVSVVLGGLQVFDLWTPTEVQNQWIYTALLPLLIAAGAWFGRHHAWSPASVDRLTAQNRAAPKEPAAHLNIIPMPPPGPLPTPPTGGGTSAPGPRAPLQPPPVRDPSGATYSAPGAPQDSGLLDPNRVGGRADYGP